MPSVFLAVLSLALIAVGLGLIYLPLALLAVGIALGLLSYDVRPDGAES